MEINMKVIGQKTKLKAKGLILIIMGQDILVTGLMISNMDSEKKHGKMELFMKVTTTQVKKMEKVK